MGINTTGSGPEPIGAGALEGSPAGPRRQAISPYLRAIRRHWLIVLALTVLTGAVAGYTATKAGYTYKATANLLVTPLPENPNYLGLGVVLDTGDPTRTVQTAAALVETDQAAAATAAASKGIWSSAQVQKAVSVDSLGQTNVLAVSGRASTPQAAAQLANLYARTALAVHGRAVQRSIAAEIASLKSQLAALPSGSPTTASQASSLSAQLGALEALKSTGNDPTLALSQPATVPGSHSGASHILIILLALLGGFAVASVAVLGIDFFGRPVKDEDELETLFPVPLLASIPRVGHRRRGPLAPWMFPPAAFEQVRMLRVQLDLAVQAPLIAVTSAGSGDGKTTLVAALAAAFAEGGGDVIVVDLDFHRPTLASVLEIDDTTATGAGQGRGPAGALLQAPRLPGVKLLPLPIRESTTPDAFMNRLPIVLAQAQRAASCVILDTAPVGQVSETMRITAMAEAVVFVARPGHTDRHLLIRARDLLARAGARPAGLVLVGQSTPGTGDSYYYSSYGTENGLAPTRAPDEPVDRSDGAIENGSPADAPVLASETDAESDETS